MLKRHVVAFAFLLNLCIAFAEVSTAYIFGDYMVLQRNMPVPVWGKAAAGENVKVEFAGQTLETTADKDGSWMVKLAPMQANSTPQEMKINNIVLKEVLVGEVWICCGEVMDQLKIDKNKVPQHPVNPLFRIGPVISENAWEDSPKHQFRSNNRIFGNSSDENWRMVEVGREFKLPSAAYYFGRELQNKLKIPVGMICIPITKTSIESLTPPCGFNTVPQLKEIADTVYAKIPGSQQYKAMSADTIASFQAWLDQFKEASSKNHALQPPPDYPLALRKIKYPGEPTARYNAAIYPMTPFALRGIIWQHGISNTKDSSSLYACKMQALYNGWKEVFQNPELKFYFTQLPPNVQSRNSNFFNREIDGLPKIWQAQNEFEKANSPKAGMVVTHDVMTINYSYSGSFGLVNANFAQGKNDEIGKRLANFALARDYGFKDVKPDFPHCVSSKIVGNTRVLSFENVEKWIVKNNGPISGFEVSEMGIDYKPADVVIQGTDLVLSNLAIPHPRAVRYLWNPEASGVLFNENNLPLPPFDVPCDYAATFNEKENADWQLAYEYDLKKGISHKAIQYTVDNSAKLTGKVKKVAYFVMKTGKDSKWLSVTMDVAPSDISKFGIPPYKKKLNAGHMGTNIFIQTDCEGIPTGNFPEGIIRFAESMPADEMSRFSNEIDYNASIMLMGTVNANINEIRLFNFSYSRFAEKFLFNEILPPAKPNRNMMPMRRIPMAMDMDDKDIISFKIYVVME